MEDKTSCMSDGPFWASKEKEERHAEYQNIERIAELWNAWLNIRLCDRGTQLSIHDVKTMLVMEKMAESIYIREKSSTIYDDDTPFGVAGLSTFYHEKEKR